jgi:hypothetical protein
LPPDQCHKQGVCDPSTGVCSNPEKCSGSQICQSDGTCCLPDTADLQAAIDGAAAGDTIPLCAGTWNLTSTVSISKNLTVIGAGTGVGGSALDGGNTVRVLDIADGATVTLQDLTITRGFLPVNGPGGGGIINAGTLTLRGVSVTGNAAFYAAGIFNLYGTLTLQDGSSVTGNTSANTGGGIENGYGTVALETGSHVTGNTAASGGGGIFNSGGILTLRNDSSVTGNTSAAGGGIHNQTGTVTLETGSSVSGNRATLYGGGISDTEGTVTLRSGSRVTGNTAANGGGVFTASGRVTLDTDAIVCSNTTLETQCAVFGSGSISGTCPAPSQECPS